MPLQLSNLYPFLVGSILLLIIVGGLSYKLSRTPQDKGLYSLYEIHVGRNNKYVTTYKVRAFSYLHAVIKISKKHFKKDFSVRYSLKKESFN